MRGANAYQALNETHQRLDGEIEISVPGRRYEALRDTQHELDAARPQEQQQGGSQSDLSRRIDRAEERRAALDQDLAETRQASRSPEQGAGQQRSQEDSAIERALALKNSPSPAQATAPPQNYAPPKDWADSGGMVAQQNSAHAWLRQSYEQQQQRAAPPPAPSQGLRPQDQELLNAARAHEAQGREQEPSRSKAHEYPGP